MIWVTDPCFRTEGPVKAIGTHLALFGKAPRAFAYDRLGSSAKSPKTLKQPSVK